MSNIIKISREFSNSQLGNLWLGREITIDDSADPISAFVKANEELNEAYGRLTGENGYWPVDKNGTNIHEGDILRNGEVLPTIQVSKTDKAIDNIKQEIMNCKDVTTLQTYRKIANTEEELVQAFNSKMKELQ